jgi:hypothetical protein
MEQLFEKLRPLGQCGDFAVSIEARDMWIDLSIDRGPGVAICLDALPEMAPYALILAMALMALFALRMVRRRVR